MNHFKAYLFGALALLLSACGPEPADTEATEETTAETEEATVAVGPTATLLDQVASDERFTTLRGLLDLLPETKRALGGTGPFTVFAPTDAAFADIPQNTLDELTQEGNRAQLQAVLARHVVQGYLTADSLNEVDALTTLGGEQVEVDNAPEALGINGALVSTADVQAANGVIHVVEAVIMPTESD